MSAEAFAAWVQAVGSILAILISVWIARWTLRQGARLEETRRITDDAAFASYIRDHLNRLGGRIDAIAASVNRTRAGETLSSVCEKAFRAYEKEVIRPLDRLGQLPLTEWPDIELANFFYEAQLRMADDVEALKAETTRLVAEEEEASRAAFLETETAAARAAQLSEQEEDEAEAYLGSFQGDEVVRLPPRGERLLLARRVMAAQSPDDEAESLDPWQRNRSDREAAMREAEMLDRAARRQELSDLDAYIFAPLRAITAEWSDRDAPLYAALDRYIGLANRRGLPLTYQGRAESGRGEGR